MQLTRARIAEIAAKLRRMPPAPTENLSITKQEAVKLLKGEIGSLQRRGYSLEQIVASLKGEGIDLSTPTMKSYLSRAKAATGRRRRTPPSSRQTEKLAAPLTPETAPASTKAETPAKSGKDAFLVKDKDSY